MKTRHLINWDILSAYLEPNVCDGLHEVRTINSSASISLRSPQLVPPPPPYRAIFRTVQNATEMLSSAWQWIQERQVTRSNTRRLHVATTVSLGEKRFVAVVQIDGQQFLVGGGATNVALLAQLDSNQSLNSLLGDTMTAPSELPLKRTRKSLGRPAAKRTGTLA
jgi:hypothetical protein